MAIGFTDLIATAVLHSQGLIVELNPIMRPLIERNEWLFAAVKGATLLLAYFVMAKYCQTHREFVRRAALAGSLAYAVIWTVWFATGTLA